MFLRCPALFSSSTLSLATYVATKLSKTSSRDREKSKQDRVEAKYQWSVVVSQSSVLK